MPKVVDHEKRRAEILDQCFALFADQGYAAMSMRGIARALGVSTGTLYYYFDSKAAIFEASIQRLSQQNAETLTLAAAAASLDRAARIEVLRSFLREQLPQLQQILQLALEYRRQKEGPIPADVLDNTLGVYHTLLRDLLGLRTDAAASTALSLLIGALIQHRLEPERVDLDAHLEQLLDW